MKYQSTREASAHIGAAEAILRGIAPDGGLYVPESLEMPDFDARGAAEEKEYKALAVRVLGALLPDVENMDELVRRAYDGKFRADGEVSPLQSVGDRYVLELFHGPTSAFKDVALSILPQFMTQARSQRGEGGETMILTATSGDTGKAAMEGFCDVDGTRIIVFYPDSGVSAVQKAQMVTQEGKNVCVCAVRGNFDDAQSGVKKIFSECADGRFGKYGVELSSANSINIGRLAPQVVYYFRAYGELMRMGKVQWGETVDFCVPTGNFGNILAGYIAMRMGLPVGRLVCASNANDVLADFLESGVYDRNRPFHKTISPSMDILISSNLERLLYFAGGGSEVKDWMAQLAKDGRYRVSDAVREHIAKYFAPGRCDDAKTCETIGKVWREHHYLCDTHTAVAWDAASRYIDEKRPMVVLSTASAYKFPAAVLGAIGGDLSGDEFDQMERLAELTGVPMPKNLCGLRTRTVRHESCIERGDMLDFVTRQVERA
ncbi:MAG: threonine synthase [Oscillospiraceae bacterium]|nr:threonine synthase [Oscillospiraceae bacterium]